MTWQNGDCLQNGKYLILEELGEGGFGITYKAKHTHLNQIVVIKTPNDDLKNDSNYPRFVERFIEEGRKLASLSEKKHPHIVRATDLFFEGTLPCLAMDFVEGKNLFKIVERNPLSEAKALEYIRQIGDALCVVHGVGMVHRDAHPANIMVKPDGNAVLIDFGLAADVAAAIPSSRHPANRAFAPYEQETGNGLPTVDVYTLAATLYFIVTRRPPTTAFDRKFNKLALPEPKSFNSNISKELNSAILKGMQLEARNRPQSMRAWLDLLPNSQVTGSNSLKLPVGLIILVLAIGGGGFYLWQNFKPSTPLAPITSPSSPALDKDKEAEALVTRAIDKSVNKDYKGAIADYTEAIRLKPNYAYAYLLKASVHSILKDSQSAISDLNKAIEISPKYAQAYSSRGLEKQNLGDKKGAIADYNQSIRLEPDSVTYFLRGNLQLSLDDKKAAIADYSESIKLNPQFPLTYFNRGVTKADIKDSQGAITDYDEAIRLKPDYFEAYYARSKSKTYLKDYEGAINDLNSVIRLKPDDAEAYFKRGLLRYLLGDKQSAMNDWNESIRINPSSVILYANRGKLKDDLGDKQGAITDYDQAIKLQPDYDQVYVSRGFVKYSLGDKQGAINDIRKASEIFKSKGNTENYNLTIKAIEQLQQ